MKWSDYNQSLVRRGEIIIGFDAVDNWDKELKEMNKDKVGRPFHHTNHFFFTCLDILKYTFIYHIDRPKTKFHNGALKGNYLLFLIAVQ